MMSSAENFLNRSYPRFVSISLQLTPLRRMERKMEKRRRKVRGKYEKRRKSGTRGDKEEEEEGRRERSWMTDAVECLKRQNSARR